MTRIAHVGQVEAAGPWPGPVAIEPSAGTRWHQLTIAALVLGYAGYYVCRSNLSVAAPLIVADGTLAGVSNATIGAIASAGILAYAIGKPFTGVAGDLLGGRRTFVLAMWGTVLATMTFGAGTGAAMLTAAWIVNRFIQSAGWGAATKLVAQWFDPARHGRIAGVLSLSYLFGDAAARLGLGMLLASGYGWRAAFFTSAAVLAAIAVLVDRVVRERPAERGLPDPAGSAHTVYGDGTPAPYYSATALLAPLVASPTFWLICALSSGLTLVREAFNIWTPTFLAVTYGMSAGDAARWSALFPLMGGVSVLAVGAASDRLGPGRRMIVAAPLVLLAGVLALTAASGVVLKHQALGLIALGGIALLLIGPYSLMAGAMALELGGKRGASTAAGLIDTAGYLGALFSGVAVGAMADASGWEAALRLLGGVTIAMSFVAGALAWWEWRSPGASVT